MLCVTAQLFLLCQPTIMAPATNRFAKSWEEMHMKFLRTIFAVLALTLLGATLATGARADEWNKRTVLTFSQPVEIPGQILPAGTYAFVLLDSPADRHIVQIFSADGSHLIA